MSAEGWVLIIGAIFLGITKVTSMILDHFRAKELSRDMKVVADKVEVVHKATNSLTEQLVNKTDQAAFARGGHEEREKAKPEAAARERHIKDMEAELKEDISLVPEKTAEKVVEKLQDESEA